MVGIEDNRIVDIKGVGFPGVPIDPERRPQLAENGHEIDVEGMYVLPGLIDMHGHIGGVSQGTPAEYVFKLWMGHGITTIRDPACGNGLVAAGRGDTELFISPGYEMQVVDVVLTNFHAPRTTLIVMIAALLGDRWRDLYEHAVASGYRFLSFGDAMLIL